MVKKICVTGLGFVGLPVASLLAASGYAVLGVDTNAERIRQIQSLNLIEPEPALLDLVMNALQTGNLTLSTSAASAEIHVIAVPTPLLVGNQPDISHVLAAVDAISPYLRAKDLVLIESTCPIGTTEALACRLPQGVYVAYCPERVLPGNILHELIHNDRVVGGVDEASTLQAANFYRSFVQGKVLTTHARTAEAVKLAENSYRDLNIAYANQLSMVADHLGIDVNEVIALANRHPRVKILQPGPGVGGHCVAIDPWFLVSSAPDLTLLTAKAREVNKQKTAWVIQKVQEAIQKRGAQAVACLGLTYKPQVADTRESAALAIVKALENVVEVLRVDPYLPNTVGLDEALERAEIVVGLVAHEAFLKIPKAQLMGKIVLDFAGIFQ